MNNEHIAARFFDGAHKVTDKVVAFNLVNANAVLHRDGHRHHIDHGFDTIGHQLWLIHEARAKGTALHSVAGTTTVQIDFVIAPLLSQFGGKGQIGGVVTPNCKATGCSSVLKRRCLSTLPCRNAPVVTISV